MWHIAVPCRGTVLLKLRITTTVCRAVKYTSLCCEMTFWKITTSTIGFMVESLRVMGNHREGSLRLEILKLIAASQHKKEQMAGDTGAAPNRLGTAPSAK